jgi:lysozyme
MRVILLSLCLTSSCLALTNTQYRAHLIEFEGYRNKPYKDSGGYSVGIGHYSRKPFPKNYYSNKEIEILFRGDLLRALSLAKETFPSFNEQPDQIKLILVSMSFNLNNGIKDFVKFRAAIERRDYNRAAIELRNSKWARQVKGRAAKYIKILKELP